MKEFKLSTKSILLVLAVQIFFLSCNFPVSASSYNEYSISTATEGIHTLSNNIGWRFKTVNGKTYKRLYNYSKNKWIGDWILVS